MSKWSDKSGRAYWNKLLKEEGLGTVKGRQVFKRQQGESRAERAKRIERQERAGVFTERRRAAS